MILARWEAAVILTILAGCLIAELSILVDMIRWQRRSR